MILPEAHPWFMKLDITQEPITVRSFNFSILKCYPNITNCKNWLVVWTCFIFPYIGNNNPNWLIFFRGVETTNQMWKDSEHVWTCLNQSSQQFVRIQWMKLEGLIFEPLAGSTKAEEIKLRMRSLGILLWNIVEVLCSNSNNFVCYYYLS